MFTATYHFSFLTDVKHYYLLFGEDDTGSIPLFVNILVKRLSIITTTLHNVNKVNIGNNNNFFILI